MFDTLITKGQLRDDDEQRTAVLFFFGPGLNPMDGPGRGKKQR